MKFTLWIVILSLTLSILLGTVGITPTSAVSGYRKLLQLGRGSIESAEWHPSGKWIVVNTVMGAWFYDDSLQDIAHLDDIRVAHFNATGDLLAAAQGNQVVLFEAMTMTVVKVLDNADGEIVDLRWSPDGKKLAVITDKPMVTVWETNTYRKLMTFKIAANDLSAVYWSPHSDKIVAVDANRTQYVIWNIETQKSQIIFDKIAIYHEQLVWNPDNRHLLRAVSGGELPPFQHWDTSTGTLLYEEARNIRWMAFSNNGAHLAWSIEYQGSSILDPLTFEKQRSLEEPFDDTTLLRWSPDDRLLAGGGGSKYDKINGIIRVWNPTTGKVVDTFESHSLVQMMDWSPDSKLILSITEDNMLRILDVGTGKIAHERADHTLIGKTVVWSPDGSRIAVADSIGGVRIWDVASGQVLQTITDYNTTMLLAWQPAGNLLAIASYDDTWLLGFAKNAKLRIWDTITGQAVGSSPYIEDSPLLSLSWDRQGSRLVVTNYNSQFWLWDKTGLSNINWYKESGTETYAIVLDTSFSPDGKYILILANVCCAGPSPHIWDVTKHKFIQLEGIRSGAHRYAWDSTLNRLYMASWYLDLRATGEHYAPASLEQTKVFVSTIYQTDTQVTTPDLVLVNPTRQVNFAEWNPNATRLAIINEDKALRIWDTRTGNKLLVINDAIDATWSPDGTKLAVRGSRATTRIVNAGNGEVMDTIDNLGQSPIWSPDSTRIADVSSGTLTIWGKE